MTDDARVEQLLEQLLESGGTPEEVCRPCPELLASVRAGWQELRVLEAEVSALFPESSSEDSANPNDTRPQEQPTPDLPHVRGYELQELLGRGGMGIVYKAWHLRLRRPVAVKMLLAGAYAQPEELERFLREAETVAGLRHANIVQVHEAGDVDGRPYFTMEFVEGGNLAQKLAGTPQPARQAAALVATVAEAVHAAHQRGIVHRDLKPGNILLTADGTPKVTDFGLARRLEGTAGLTQSGAPLGTPSYMAPEQAEGRSRDVGPAADTYALGAILYELLTGRPPFRAETAAETLRQVVSQAPVPPSRLNAAVPRDPETICLKCLEKDPQRRYASAAALAEDLRRFQRDEPIVARPVGPVENVLRWTRRHPTGAALVATALALVGLAIGGGAWLVQVRAERWVELRSEVGTAVAQAKTLRERYHFHEARALLDQAGQQLGPAGPDELRRQVDQAQADLELVEDLDSARMRAPSAMGGKFEAAGLDSLYEEAFAKARLGRPGDDSEAVAARVWGSAVRAEIVAALDDWASVTQDSARRAWLLEVARRADPDPLRDRLRRPELWQDASSLKRIVRELRGEELSPQLLTALVRVSRHTPGELVPLLTAAQARFPQDFWLTLELAWALDAAQQSDEALGYLRAALALRPDAPLVHNNLGAILDRKGRLDDAISHYEQTLRLDPRYTLAHINLGRALRAKGHPEEALRHCEQALLLDPKSAMAHYALALALRDKGRLDEATSHYQEVLRLGAEWSEWVHFDLGLALQVTGQFDEAMAEYRRAIQLNPKLAAAHYQLGVCWQVRGRLDEAAAEYRRAVEFDPGGGLGHEWLAEALLRSGRFAEARKAVRYGLDVLPAQEPRRPALWEKLKLCERMLALDARLPALVRGKERPAAAELLKLARLCRDYGRPHAAADLYAAAFTARPALADDLQTGDRYSAACAAARAAAGEGPDGAQLGRPERAGLRRQALAWLRADLALRTTQFQGGKSVDWALTIWQTDTALTGVRDPEALANLPDAEREQWQRHWADVAALRAADPMGQGRMHVARRRWAPAADDYARALKRGTTDDGEVWFEYAALMLLSGDRPGYAKACARMVERYGKASNLRAYHVARACTLAPDAVANASLPKRLPEAELKAAAGQFWSLTEQGALHYRAGRFQQAVALFEQSLRADPKPGRAVLNWLWLALANQHLGKPEEARRWLDKATAWLDQYRDGMPDRAEGLGLDLHNWLEAHVLRRDAEAVIRPAGPR
jgi:eukaryotic-like serine/threonine-protein kinase